MRRFRYSARLEKPRYDSDDDGSHRAIECSGLGVEVDDSGDRTGGLALVALAATPSQADSGIQNWNCRQRTGEGERYRRPLELSQGGLLAAAMEHTPFPITHSMQLRRER